MTTAARIRRPKAGKPKKVGEVTLRRMDLSKTDRAAAAFVQNAYGLSTFVAAVRVSLRQQTIRDAVMGCPRREPADKDGQARLLIGGRPTAGMYRSLTEGLLHRQGDVATVRMGDDLGQGLFRFFPDDERHLAEVQSGWGFLCNVEAVRFALRVQAVLAGWPRSADDGW